MGKLWPQPRLTWDIGLANAAWKVRVAAAGGPGDAAQVVKDFRDAMFAGVAAARLQLIAGDDVLDRLPYVGSPSRTWALWSHPGSRWFTWLLSIAGWLITAFMASLGAPMWFDLLNKLINRRITGPKPVSAPAPEA